MFITFGLLGAAPASAQSPKLEKLWETESVVRRVEQLVDSRAEKKNAAGIGYDPRRSILYVPTFNGKTVTAYRLK